MDNRQSSMARPVPLYRPGSRQRRILDAARECVEGQVPRKAMALRLAISCKAL